MNDFDYYVLADGRRIGYRSFGVLFVAGEIKAGSRFLHKRWLTPDTKSHAVCKVFAVREGSVYYGLEDESKATAYASVQNFGKDVQTWIS